MNFIRYNEKKSRNDLARYRGPPFGAVLSLISNDTTPHQNASNIQQADRSAQSAVSSNKNVTTTSKSSRDSITIFAITQGRSEAQSEIGIAAINLSSPELILCQFSDDPWFTGLLVKIQKFLPNVIIIPQTLMNNINSSANDNKLVERVKTTFPHISLSNYPRRVFNTRDGLDFITQFCASNYQPIISSLTEKYYALCAASALFHYMQMEIRMKFMAKSLKIRYEVKSATMMIDIQTSNRLELLYPLCQTREKQTCLYGILDRCVTMIGKRMLRAKILEPDYNLQILNNSYDAIAELSENSEALATIGGILKKFLNIDKLLKITLIPNGDTSNEIIGAMINQVIALKSSLKNIPTLLDVLRDLNGTQFSSLKNILNNSQYKTMLEKIESILHSNVESGCGMNQYFQRIHVVQQNVNHFLDLARSNYTQILDNMNELIKLAKIKYNLQLTLFHTVSRGFHIKLLLQKNQPVPMLSPEFEVLLKTKAYILLTTKQMTNLNFRMQTVLIDINQINLKIINGLIEELIVHINAIYDLVAYIGSLDIIMAFTQITLCDGYCRPNFGKEMRITEAVHPILKYSEMKIEPTPNNIIATPEYNFFVITGPNMGGKTVYLKLIAILQIMAQIGCYVPANKAQFRLTNMIFIRMGFSDKIEQNMSNFTAEIEEIGYLFKCITPVSLVIIDELCRSTNPEEGSTLAWKICEKLLQKKGFMADMNSTESIKLITSYEQVHNKRLNDVSCPFIFLTTHYMNMGKLADKYFNVINLNFMAEENIVNGKLNLIYTHQIAEGVTPIKGYGLALARNVRIPKTTLNRAEEIYLNLLEKEVNISVIDHAGTNPGNISIRSLPNQTISSFIGRTLLPRTKNASTSLLSVAYPGERTFYNLFGDLGKNFREQNNSVQELQIRLTELLDEFLLEQSPDTIEYLRKTNSNDFLNKSTRFERPQKNLSETVNINISTKTANANIVQTYSIENVETDEEIVSITQNMKPNLSIKSKHNKECTSTQPFIENNFVNLKNLRTHELYQFGNEPFTPLNIIHDIDIFGFEKEKYNIARFYDLNSSNIDARKYKPKPQLGKISPISSTTDSTISDNRKTFNVPTLKKKRLNPYIPQPCSKFQFQASTSGICQQRNPNATWKNRKQTSTSSSGCSIPLTSKNVKKEIFPIIIGKSEKSSREVTVPPRICLKSHELDRFQPSGICQKRNLNAIWNRTLSSQFPKIGSDRQHRDIATTTSSNIVKNEIRSGEVLAQPKRSTRSVSVQFPESCTESIEIKSILATTNPIVNRSNKNTDLRKNNATISTNSVLISSDSSYRQVDISNVNQESNQDLETISLSSESSIESDFHSCANQNKKCETENGLSETINIEIDSGNGNNARNLTSGSELSTISNRRDYKKNILPISHEQIKKEKNNDETLNETQTDHDHRSSSLYPQTRSISNKTNPTDSIAESVSRKTISISSTLRKFHPGNEENEISTDEKTTILPPPLAFS